MRVAVAGAHGQVARHLARRLTDRGDEVLGLVRNPVHAAALQTLGVEPVVADLEAVGAEELAGHLTGADAVVFAAGAGPGSGAARKDTVDRAAAVLLADAAERAGTARYLLLSSMGVESVRDGAPGPQGADEVFVAYLRAKLAAEEELRSRAALALTVLRPGHLSDEEPTDRVLLAPSVPPGAVPRADVAAVLVALLDAPATSGAVLELVSGDDPVAAAVAAHALG